MVRAAFVDKHGVKKGEWSEEEDQKLSAFVLKYGYLNWRLVPKYAGLNRCGKSCRLRWMNYLKPNVRRGNFTTQERDLVKSLHDEYGNKWSAIAKKLPGRTDHEIKNYWHTHFNKQRTRSVKKSGQQEQTKIAQEKSSESLIAQHWMNFTKSREISCSNSCLKKQEKSEIDSSDVFIFESSSSSSNSGVSDDAAAAAAVDLDLDSIVDQVWSEMVSQPSDVVVDFKRRCDDDSSFSYTVNSVSGFKESAMDACQEIDFSLFYDCGFYFNQILGFEDDYEMKLF